MNRKTIVTVVSAQILYALVLAWVALYQADAYRPVHPNSQEWVRNVQQKVQVPDSTVQFSWKGQKCAQETGNFLSCIDVFSSRSFQHHLALIFKLYTSSIQGLVVHLRKSDLIFPFHYDW